MFLPCEFLWVMDPVELAAIPSRLVSPWFAWDVEIVRTSQGSRVVLTLIALQATLNPPLMYLLAIQGQ